MKTINQRAIPTLLLFLFVLLGTLTGFAEGFLPPSVNPGCEDFSNGIGNWQGSFATAVINSPGGPGDAFLQGSDQNNFSHIYSEDCSGDLSCQSLCFDYQLISDGHNDQTLFIPPNITLYQGNIASPAIMARFEDPQLITENDGWVTVCVDLIPGDLPANWVMTTGTAADWDALINNVSGIAFTTDIAGLGPNPDPQTTGEVIGVDNICLRGLECCPPQQDCYDFDNGVGVWQANTNTTIGTSTAAPTSDGTAYLTGNDGFGPSWIFNEQFCEDNDLSCTQLCFDYTVISDGQPGMTLNIAPTIVIYQGNINAPTLRARFTAPFTITENDGWVQNICTDLGTLSIPDNWAMLDNAADDQWGVLITDITGIAFTTDVALPPNNNTIGEAIGVDNVCITDLNEPPMDATVYLQPSNFGPQYHTLSPVGYDPYTGLNVTHEWYLFSAPTVDGPYTPVAYYEGESFAYELAEYEVYYFLAHRVTGVCSEDCATTYNKNGGSEERNDGGETDRNSFSCDLINTFSNCEDLAAPTNLMVENGFLTWSPVAGATSYTVSAVIGGHNGCLCGVGPGIPVGLGNTENPYFDVPSGLASECFSWTVVAICGDGVSSLPSEVACHYPTQLGGDEGSGEDGGRSGNLSGFSTGGSISELRVYPNPASDVLNLNIPQGMNLQRVELLNSKGQLMMTRVYPQETLQDQINLTDYPRGLYYLKVFDESGESHAKKIVLQ